MKTKSNIRCLYIAFLFLGDANAITISANTPVVYRAYMPHWSSSNGLDLQLKLICVAPANYVAKWTSIGSTHTGDFRQPCDPNGALWDTGFSVSRSDKQLAFSFNITVTPSDADVDIPNNVYLEWQLINSFGTRTYGQGVRSEQITPAKNCSVDVSPYIEMPDLKPGDKVNDVIFINNAAGEGYLTFKPVYHDEHGGLLKGGNVNTLAYSVTDSAWNAADAEWRGILTTGLYSIRLGDVPLSAQPEVYSGAMNVIIQCD